MPPLAASATLNTVLQTHATSLLQMARIALLNNAGTRLPFAGVAELYAALSVGYDGRRRTPIFYLSRSPWNL